MSAEDYIEEARAETDGGIIGGILALLIMSSCANTPQQVNQNKESEKAPIRIEHRENPATNQFCKMSRSYMIHMR